MTTWTGFSTLAFLTACFVGTGCSDDGLAPIAGSSSSSGVATSANPSTMGGGTVPLPDSSGDLEGTGDDTGESTASGLGSSSGAEPGSSTGTDSGDTDPVADSGSTGTGSTGSTGTDSGSSDTGSSSGSSDTGSSSGGSSSTGPAGNVYEGSYDGIWEGMCPGIGAVNGTFMFDVAMDGILSGTIAGFDNGPMSGTVDDMGVVAANVMAMLGGACTFDGQIDMMGDVTGTWNCPNFGCIGTWMGSQMP
ncbi:MAG: hypothetical protein AAGF11_00895 [Myxococcota bacterium]